MDIKELVSIFHIQFMVLVAIQSHYQNSRDIFEESRCNKASKNKTGNKQFKTVLNTVLNWEPTCESPHVWAQISLKTNLFVFVLLLLVKDLTLAQVKENLMAFSLCRPVCLRLFDVFCVLQVREWRTSRCWWTNLCRLSRRHHWRAVPSQASPSTETCPSGESAPSTTPTHITVELFFSALTSM